MMDDSHVLVKEKMKRSGLYIKEQLHGWRLCAVEAKRNKKMVNCMQEPVFHTVINVSGSSTTGRRLIHGRIYSRHFKLANAIMHEDEVRIGGKLC